ncbi:MAG: hypothetical protein WBY88_08695, partial [Desulfosarcina sp.]
MGHLAKHLAVRLWTALVIGGLAALVLLAPVAGMWGPEWMILPGLALLGMAYWLTGMAFAAIGRHRVQRLLGEATVWERAGMSREVSQVLGRAVAAVDSFFFSPHSRKEPAARLLAQTARFQLAQSEPESSSDTLVGAYLHAFPNDRDAAVKWLDGVLAGKGVTQLCHDIAARIGSAHSEDVAIQRMLAQFYLAERRCDATALETYRQVIDTGQPLPKTLIADMADLFLSQPRIDGLALHVYLTAHEHGGERDPRLLSAISACCRLIHPSPLTLPLLKRAEVLMDGIDAARRNAMAAAFLPDDIEVESDRFQDGGHINWMAIGSIMRRSFTAGAAWISRSAVELAGQLQKNRARLRSKRFKSVLKGLAMALLATGVGWLVVNTVIH